MKKGQEIIGTVERVDFPNKGIVLVEDNETKQWTGETVFVKNVIAGQKVCARIHKVRSGKKEACLLKVLEPAQGELTLADGICPHFTVCGGCTYQQMKYEDQLAMKSEQIQRLLDDVIRTPYEFEGIRRSPNQYAFRNKMEFSFGDEYKDGPLALGLHKRGSMYDIVSVTECRIVDENYRSILACTQEFYRKLSLPFYHKLRHEGMMRHLLVRKSEKNKTYLVALVTTGTLPDGRAANDYEELAKALHLEEYTKTLLSLSLDGRITGILHIVNDGMADMVRSDRTQLLYGRDALEEELLGLQFLISPFSFFQTNSKGAEVLYETVRSYVGTTKDKVIFDLYSGTGTIAQLLAPVAKKVIGIEIVEEAVEAARINAGINGLSNCEFIAGDVLKMLDTIAEKPDFIVLDPPRDGIHPKALKKIIDYGVEQMVYISCKPTSLARDLEMLQACGYHVIKVCAVDMFPQTAHVETVVLMSKKEPC